MDLRGKAALVTGGSGDTGSAIARALAEAGAHVAITFAGHAEGAQATVAAVQSLGRRSIALQLDQRDATAIEPFAELLEEEFGPVSILINNAGWNIGIPFPDLDQLTADIWDRVLETNLRGPYLLSRALAKQLRASGNGRIVNIASIGGLYPGSSSIAYSASKAGLIHLTRCLAVAMSPDVAVNCIAPGLIEGTRMAKRLPADVADWARRQAVLGHTASIEDIAHQVVMFCQSDSITGQVLVIDGGMPGAMH